MVIHSEDAPVTHHAVVRPSRLDLLAPLAMSLPELLQLIRRLVPELQHCLDLLRYSFVPSTLETLRLTAGAAVVLNILLSVLTFLLVFTHLFSFL